MYDAILHSVKYLGTLSNVIRGERVKSKDSVGVAKWYLRINKTINRSNEEKTFEIRI